MVIAGELLRNRLRMIPQGLAAAGVAVLYAGLWAGVQWIECIDPLVGFGCLVVTTAAAVTLSLRHGPLVALLGLLGGFLTPVMVRTGSDQPEVLLYVLLLQAGLLCLTRYRNWYLLSGLTMVGAVAWGLVWVVFLSVPDDHWYLGPYLIATMAIHLWLSMGAASADARFSIVLQRSASWAGMIAGMVLLAGMVGRDDFTVETWLFMGIMSVGVLALARISERYEPLAWLSAALGLVLVTAWHGADIWEVSDGSTAYEVRFAWVLFGFGALHTVGPIAVMWGSAAAWRWATASVAAVLGFGLVGYGHFMDVNPLGMRWWVACLIVAGLYVIPFGAVLRQRATMREAERALAALAVGITALVSLALAIALETQWLTIALGLEVAALALIYEWLKVRALRRLAGIATAITAVRLLANPMVLEYEFGTTVVWNGLLSTYGAPLAALAIAAWRLRQDLDDALVTALEWCAVVVGVALVGLEVHHAFGGGDLTGVTFPLHERAALVNLMWVGGLGLFVIGRWLGREAYRDGGTTVFGLTLIAAVVVLCGIDNPLWADHKIGGTPVWNVLLYLYGVPTVLLLIAGWVYRRCGELTWSWAMTGATALFGFVLVSLEIHHGFHLEDMHDRSISLTQWGSMTTAWMALGGLMWLMDRVWREAAWPASGMIVGGLGVVVSIWVLCIVQNPLLTGQVVEGGAIV